MKFKSIALALIGLLAAQLCALAGSTIDPTQPPLNGKLLSAPVRNNFVASFNDINNLLAQFAGPNPPAIPTPGQIWRNTSATPNVVNQWSGTAWLQIGTFDAIGGTITPFFGNRLLAWQELIPGLGTTGQCLVFTGALTNPTPQNCLNGSSFAATAPIAANTVGATTTLSLGLDSNFASVGGNLALTPIASGSLIGNCVGSSAEPAGCSWTSFANQAIGSANGVFPLRFSGAWQAGSFDATHIISAGVVSLNLGNPNTWTGQQTFVAPIAINNTATVTSASASALAVGLNGATNPAFQIDASSASQAAGLRITGAATGGVVNIVATDSGANTSVALNAKGTGNIGIGTVSTGAVNVGAAINLNSGGSLTGTFTGTPTLSGANFITNANLVQPGAATLKGNPTASSTANEQPFTVQGLTNLAAPSATLDFVLIYDHVSGTIKSVTPGAIASSGVAGVASLNTLTGALSIGAGGGISVTPSGSTVTVALAPPYFEAYLSANQTGVIGGAFTLININTIVKDSNSWFSTSTHKYTPQLAGSYLVTAKLRCSNTSVAACLASIYLNGSEYARGVTNNPSSATVSDSIVTIIVPCNGTTDFLTFEGVEQGTGGADAFAGGTAPQITFLQAQYIGP